MATAGTEGELHAAVIHTPATAVAAVHTACLYLGTCPRMRGGSEGTVKSHRVHPVPMDETEPVNPGQIDGAAQVPYQFQDAKDHVDYLASRSAPLCALALV